MEDKEGKKREEGEREREIQEKNLLQITQLPKLRLLQMDTYYTSLYFTDPIPLFYFLTTVQLNRNVLNSFT